MSKHKDDLVHIKDMYKLLRFKGTRPSWIYTLDTYKVIGYRFPELRDSSVAALAPTDVRTKPKKIWMKKKLIVYI